MDYASLSSPGTSSISPAAGADAVAVAMSRTVPVKDENAFPSEQPRKKQKRNKPTLSCEECVERKTKVRARYPLPSHPALNPPPIDHFLFPHVLSPFSWNSTSDLSPREEKTGCFARHCDTIHRIFVFAICSSRSPPALPAVKPRPVSQWCKFSLRTHSDSSRALPYTWPWTSRLTDRQVLSLTHPRKYSSMGSGGCRLGISRRCISPAYH